MQGLDFADSENNFVFFYIVSRPFEVLDSCSSSMSSVSPDDPWSKTLDEEMERLAVPDGASDGASGVSNDPIVLRASTGSFPSDKEQSEENLKEKKRRRFSSLFACFPPAFKRKDSANKQNDATRSETSKLVKE